jgi:hypothetical protein
MNDYSYTSESGSDSDEDVFQDTDRQLIVKNPEMHIKNDFIDSRYLIVNSRDRNVLSENLFHFNVTLGSSTSTFEKKAIFENNRTVEQNSSQKENGIPGETNTNYRADQARGNIIGYETIRFQGDELGCCSGKTYKHIISFFCKNAILPKYPFVSSYEVYLRLGEISNNQIDSTNQLLNRIHTILVPDKKTDRSVFNPLIKDNYFNIEINNLKKFSVNLSYPNVNHGGDVKDVSEITNIQLIKNDKGFSIKAFVKDLHYLRKNSCVTFYNIKIKDITLDGFLSSSIFGRNIFYNIVDLQTQWFTVSTQLTEDIIILLNKKIKNNEMSVTRDSNYIVIDLPLDEQVKNVVLNEDFQYTLLFELVSKERKIVYF